jgi:acyl-CoA hydrolase
VDKVDFHHPIRLGDAVTLLAQVNRVFNTSMEVGVKVYSDCFRTGKRTHTNSAYLTFVSVDENLKPVKSFQIIPETDDEKRRFEDALRRRDNRLKAR